MSPGFWDHFWGNLWDYLRAVWPIALALAGVILATDWWWRRRSRELTITPPAALLSEETSHLPDVPTPPPAPS